MPLCAPHMPSPQLAGSPQASKATVVGPSNPPVPSRILGTQWAPAGRAQWLKGGARLLPSGEVPPLVELPCGQSRRLVGTCSFCGERRGACHLSCFCARRRPSAEAGKAGEGEGVKDAATIAPLDQHTPHSFHRPGGDCIPFCGPGGIGSDILLLSAIACQPFHITPTLNP